MINYLNGGLIKNFKLKPALMERVSEKLFYSFVLGISKNKGIGNKGALPWPYFSNDMKHFKNITSSVFNEGKNELDLFGSLTNYKIKNIIKGITTINVVEQKNIVVMGRSTWDALPQGKKPLPGRISVVLSRSEEFITQNPVKEHEFYAVKDIPSFFTLADHLKTGGVLNEIYVIGGAKIFTEFLKDYPDQCKLIFQTQIEKDYESDTFFDIPSSFETVSVSKTFFEPKLDLTYDFRILINPRLLTNDCETNSLKCFSKIINPVFLKQYPTHEEYQYLEAINDIIHTGSSKDDRTGTGVISKFGYQMRYDCSQTFPLLTTKDTFWRGIVEELIWFLNGDTNAKHLQEKKVHIWDGNGSREFLDKLGLTEREEGDLGPVYGFQWRHFGAEYKTMHDDYTSQGVDQLMNVINELKTNPESRRIIMCAWNVKDLKQMALPPCHCLCQFFVDAEGRLSLQMYQRSADMGLGVPFNIASYALLLRMVAQVTDLKPGEFIHTIGDAHVYKNHQNALLEQLKRTPRAFPVLKINPNVKDITGFKFADFTLLNYNPHKKIKMDMAV